MGPGGSFITNALSMIYIYIRVFIFLEIAWDPTMCANIYVCYMFF